MQLSASISHYVKQDCSLMLWHSEVMRLLSVHKKSRYSFSTVTAFKHH